MVASGGTNLSGPVEMSRSFVAPGSPGPQGGPGEKGEKGDPGEQGAQGPRGFPGDKGDKGDKGDQGIQGIQGPLGIQGSKGDQGIQGVKGDKGDTGAQGIQGIQGVKGDKGDTGAQGPSGAPVPITRSAAYCFELCQQGFNMSAATPNHLRRPFKLGIKPTRFRVRVRNRIQLSDSSPTGAEIGKIANLNIVIAKAAVDSTTGDLNGNYTAAPYEIQATTDVATGTELVSGWVDAATYPINIDEIHLLGYSFNSGNVSNSQVGLNGGFSFRDSTPANLKVVAPTTAMTRSDNAAFLQVIIEYEHQDNDARHMLVIGNSLSGPSANSGATPFPVTNVGEMGTWHQIWAQNQRCAATSIAVAGAYASHYSSASGRWNLFDGFNIPYVPDVVLCFAAASSDVADCTTSSTMDAIKVNVRNVIKYARTKYASATRVYWTNVPPRNNFSGSGATSTTNEYWRKHFNVWIHNTLPTLINGCFDLDSLLTDWADPARLRDVFTTEGVHWTVRAHQIATRILPFRRGA